MGGKYEVVRLLGEGGMAFVFEASHNRLQQRVAIKLLAPEFARDVELVKRFEREARAVARLKTKHVTRVMDVDTTAEGIPYIVMEFLEGRDLDAELHARTQLPLGEAVDYVLQACAAMIEAHGLGIVHRDLKPANLFLANEGEGEGRILKVLDFGISKVVGEATRLTSAGAVMGTVMYMSPEQVRAESNVDTRADIWALGVILYELVAGRAPWEGHSHQIAAAIVSRDPPDVRTFAQIPEAAAVCIQTMLQRDRSNRYATVRDVITALAPFAPLGSIGAGVVESVSLGQSGSRRASAVPQLKHTVPMGSRPAAIAAAAAAAAALARSRTGTEAVVTAIAPSDVPPASSPSSPSSLSSPVLTTAPVIAANARARSRARLVLLLVMSVGLLLAAGVVLIIIIASRVHPPSPATGTTTSASAAASSAERAASSASPLAEPPPATMSPASAAPPATGTSPSRPASSRPGPASSGKRGADAGAGRSPTTTGMANPPLL